jgi:broad specificity phosphatase PhoE
LTSLEQARGHSVHRASPASARRFFFVRHGETEWNRLGRLQGQTDTPLNGRGRDQAEAVGRILRRVAGERGIRASELDFVASPLDRTRTTMALMRRAMGLLPDDFRTDHRLKEISFGAWEGLTWPEVATADAPRHAERKRDRWSFVPPDGESYAQVADRLGPWLDTIPDDAVVVAHGGVARALLVMLTGLDPKLAPGVEIWQGRLLVFDAGQATWT